MVAKWKAEVENKVEMTTKDTNQVGERERRVSGPGWIGRGTRIVRTGSNKGNIPRNPHPASNNIRAAITLMLRTIPNKDTLQKMIVAKYM